MYTPRRDLPGAKPHTKARQIDRNPQQFPIGLPHGPDRKLSGLVEMVERFLLAFCIDALPKVAPLIKQADARHWEAKITRCLQLVTGHVAEPTRINGQCVAQHELHAEICNAADRSFRHCRSEEHTSELQ